MNQQVRAITGINFDAIINSSKTCYIRTEFTKFLNYFKAQMLRYRALTLKTDRRKLNEY